MIDFGKTNFLDSIKSVLPTHKTEPAHFNTLINCKPQPAHCQRDLCWSDEQKQSYLYHALTMRHGGDIILWEDKDSDNVYILDGQHRINTLLSWVSGDINFEYDGKLIKWNDLSLNDQRHVRKDLMFGIRWIQSSYNKKQAESIYNSFNFTGVKH